jgi:hypothetical protein
MEVERHFQSGKQYLCCRTTIPAACWECLPNPLNQSISGLVVKPASRSAVRGAGLPKFYVDRAIVSAGPVGSQQMGEFPISAASDCREADYEREYSSIGL